MLWPPRYAFVLQQPIACLDTRYDRRNRELRRAWRFKHTQVLKRYGVRHAAA